MIEDIRARGGKFFNTPAGFFIFDGETRHTYPLVRGDVSLGAIIYERYGINAAEYLFKLLFESLLAEAELRGEKLEIRRLAHYDRKTKHLYISRFDGHVYRLDGSSIELIPNGTDNVFFFDSPEWEHWEYIPGPRDGRLDELLIDSFFFTEKGPLSRNDQRKLLKIWLLSVFFSSLHPTKPLLLLLGEMGSGKSSGLRRILKMIFGPEAELNSLERDKLDGFVAAVTTMPVVVLDNVDESISWLPDNLARLATGTKFPRRQLYTTNQMVTFRADCWLALTAMTAKFIENRADLPDRTIVLRTERLIDYDPEERLLSEVIARRNELFSEAADELQSIVRQLQQQDEPTVVQLRMADFASFAITVAKTWGVEGEVIGILRRLGKAESDLVLEEEPIVQVLKNWLAVPTNVGREVDVATLHEELYSSAMWAILECPYPNPRSLAQRLSHILINLREKLDVEVREDSSHQKLYRFWPKKNDPESLNRSEWENREIQVCK